MKPGSKATNVSSKASCSRISTVSKAKHAGSILSAIDQLRKRKVRADVSRICHMVQRQHKLTSEQTRSELEVLANEKLVSKVDFKGTVNYRNAAKWRRLCHGKVAGKDRTIKVADDCGKRNKIGRRVLKAVKSQLGDVTKGQPAVESGGSDANSGVTLKHIENWIRDKWGADVADSMDAIKAAASAEVSKGHLVELPDGSYALHEEETNSAVSDQPQKRGPGRPKTEVKHRKSVAASESDASVNNSGSVTDLPSVPVNATKSSSQKKFGSKRKPKLRKNVDQEAESSAAKKPRSDETDVPLSSEAAAAALSVVADGDTVKCAYCQSSTNRHGDTEDLLVCKDCQANIHPSCVDLTEELARRAARSPWQCPVCKTCFVCDDSGYADEMLFCDACDKGYHMNCHTPPVLEKPTDTDKWVCCRCVAELEADVKEPTETVPLVVATNSDSRVDDCGETSCLPTPSDSPVHCREETVAKDVVPSPNVDTVVILPKLSTTLTGEPPDASSWSVADVTKYFTDIGFIEQAETFRTEEIDGKALLLMTRNDVLTGMSFKLGPALKIYAHVERLQTRGISMFR